MDRDPGRLWWTCCSDWAGDEHVDVGQLTDQVDEFIDTYHDVTLGQLDLGAMLSDMMQVVRDHGLALPPGAGSAAARPHHAGRAGAGASTPDSTWWPSLAPFSVAHCGPGYLAGSADPTPPGENMAETMDLLVGAFPRDLRRLIKAARRGAIQLNLDL